MGFFEVQNTATIALPTIPRCGACGLYKQCQSPKMKPTGRGKLQVLFVAEAPGKTEDEQGVQLVGEAGQCLREDILEPIGVDLEKCWKTNAVICRPPGNKIEPLYIDSCRPNLINTIKELKPNVIVLLGASAVESLIGVEWGGNIEELSRWVGWRIPSRRFNAWICPTYHPSYVVRSNKDPALVKITQEHIAAAMELEHTPVPTEDLLKKYRAEVECIADPRLSIKRMKGLVDKEGILGFDFETDRLKPEAPDSKIVAVSFCLNGHDTFSCAIDESCYPVLSEVLRNSRLKKIASNLKFEERWTRRKLGHGVAGWWWDTMLGAHVLDNRGGITSIKFQAYVHLGICDYNSQLKAYLEAKDKGGNTQNNIGKMHVKDLLPYCGLDSRLEYEVAMIQRRLLYAELPE